MPEFQAPELLRTPLEELCLQVKVIAGGQYTLRVRRAICTAAGHPPTYRFFPLQDFFSKAPQPPEPRAIQTGTFSRGRGSPFMSHFSSLLRLYDDAIAVDLLEQIGALDAQEVH